MDSLLNNLEVGDIIWARRYKTIKDKNKIKEGHRESPFVIIRKTNKRIFALMCTSNGKGGINHLKLKISSIKEDKETFVYFGETYAINEKNFIRKIGKINDSDLKNIKKILCSNKEFLKLKHININELDISFNYGDIITDGNIIYYIKKIDNEYLYCNIVNRSRKPKCEIIINKENYSIDVGSTHKLPLNNKFKLIKVCDIDTKNRIKEYEIKINNKLEKMKHLETGEIMEYNNQLYYTFNRYRNYMLCYKIYSISNDMIVLNIFGKKYYTNFEEEKIEVNNKIKILYCLSDYEIKLVKNTKKDYDLKKKKKRSYSEYTKGKMVINYKTLDRFIILNRINNIITMISTIDNKYVEYDLTSSNDNPYQIYDKMDNLKFKLYVKNNLQFSKIANINSI